MVHGKGSDIMASTSTRTTGKTIETTWELRSYDVWGNARDGYEVNNNFNMGEFKLRLKLETHNAGTEHEFQSASPTDKQILRLFNLTNIRLDTNQGDDILILIERERDGYPIGEMYCTSHESLSPPRKRDRSNPRPAFFRTTPPNHMHREIRSMNHDSLCDMLKTKPLSHLSSDEMRDARELAYSILRADYYRDIRDIAEDIRSRIVSGELADWEAVDTDMHETIDGCQRVTYTREAQETVMLSDNSDAVFEAGYEADSIISDGSVDYSRMAYFAVHQDVMEQLSAEGIDADYWDNLEEEEEEKTEAETSEAE